MKCHNIFTLDENRDEPTFTNDKGKFFLLDILKKEKGKRKKEIIYIQGVFERRNEKVFIDRR